MTPCWSGRMPHARKESEERGSRDGAQFRVRDRWRARARRACCVCCEGVDVRRVRSAVAVSSEVGPQVVDGEQKDVWTECGGGGVVGVCGSGEGRCGHAGLRRDAPSWRLRVKHRP